MEHDGSAISVFDKHPDEGHTNENIVGVVVLWKKSEYRKDTMKETGCCRGVYVCVAGWG